MNRHPSETVLSRYTDGDLSEGEKLAVKNHLRSCKSCMKVYSDIKKIKELAESIAPVEVPLGLFTGVKERIASRAKPAPRPALWRGILVGAALTCAVAFFAVLPHAVKPVIETKVAETVESREIYGPPLGLANAVSFGSEGLAVVEDASDSNHLVRTASHDANRDVPLEKIERVLFNQVSSTDESAPKPVLIPLDKKAWENLYGKNDVWLVSQERSAIPWVTVVETVGNEPVTKINERLLIQPHK